MSPLISHTPPPPEKLLPSPAPGDASAVLSTALGCTYQIAGASLTYFPDQEAYQAVPVTPMGRARAVRIIVIAGPHRRLLIQELALCFLLCKNPSLGSEEMAGPEIKANQRPTAQRAKAFCLAESQSTGRSTAAAAAAVL